MSQSQLSEESWLSPEWTSLTLSGGISHWMDIDSGHGLGINMVMAFGLSRMNLFDQLRSLQEPLTVGLPKAYTEPLILYLLLNDLIHSYDMASISSQSIVLIVIFHAKPRFPLPSPIHSQSCRFSQLDTSPRAPPSLFTVSSSSSSSNSLEVICAPSTPHLRYPANWPVLWVYLEFWDLAPSPISIVRILIWFTGSFYNYIFLDGDCGSAGVSLM